MHESRAGNISRRCACVMVAFLAASFALSNAASVAATARGARAASTGSKRLGGAPGPVANATATSIRSHDQNAVLALNVGLVVRNSAELDSFIEAASTSGRAGYGHYLTPAQYEQRYAPSNSDVAAVRAWLATRGLRVTGVSADNLIVRAQATTAVAERAFGVAIHDYSDGSRAFFSNDTAPTVPADLPVRTISGLDDFAVAHSFAKPASFSPGSGVGFYPDDFQHAYNTGGATTSQSIGFTLWGAPLVPGDLHQFAVNTGSPPVTINTVGADTVDFIPCSNGLGCVPGGSQSTDKTEWGETALDVESAHGVAPGSHLKYWLAATDGSGHPFEVALEDALNTAANDSTLEVVSNSWGIPADGHVTNMDTSLQHGAALGKTFFFSTGDDPIISYPATSPYVVAVGGTRLTVDGSHNYSGETVWSISGRGCSRVFGRPAWQVGVGRATCAGRAEPDVAADADPNTGAYVYVGGPGTAGEHQIGGTSLSAPLWAGMTAVWNQANFTAGKPLVGFAAPLFYKFGSNPSVYHTVFHDVTVGSTGGVAAAAGWDEASGWGSPNLTAMIAQYQHLTTTTTALAASRTAVPFGGSVAFTATVSPVPTGGTVTFRQNSISISGCTARPVTSARATCSVAFKTSGSFRVQAVYSGNADFAASPSNVTVETVAHGPGYWMAGATGVVYGFGDLANFGSAPTANVVHIEPTPSRNGYWILNRSGQVFAFGDAPALGSAVTGESASSMSSTPSGHGYWVFTDRGRVIPRGDAHFYGDLVGRPLNQPIIGSIATPTGHGYFMVATDGGIFAFGDARFRGSMGNRHLNKPVNGLVPTPTNLGYWLVASDGGIFSFGDAGFHGSMGGTALNKAVVGMVRYGNGYLMVGADGGIFDFSDKPFLGSLAGRSLPAPIVSVAS